MRYILILAGLILTTLFGAEYSNTTQKEAPVEFQANETYPVLAAIDGDTLIIETKSGEEKVRLIGIDTPEVDPNQGGPECYGIEASRRTKELTEQQRVTIELDESQGTRDVYGRLLAYVHLSDKSILNQTLIAEGYAREYTYNKSYRYQQEFRASEKTARNQNTGLWSACST
jgi:micrococcal nuclease